jgi:hypothetical protein
MKPEIRPKTIQPSIDISWVLPIDPLEFASAHQSRDFLVRRQPPLRGELIDYVGKDLGQNLCDLILGEASALGEGIDSIGTSAPEIWPGATAVFGPVLIQESTASPRPFCWNCLSKPPRPPTMVPGSGIEPGDVGAVSGRAEAGASFDPPLI